SACARSASSRSAWYSGCCSTRSAAMVSSRVSTPPALRLRQASVKNCRTCSREGLNMVFSARYVRKLHFSRGEGKHAAGRAQAHGNGGRQAPPPAGRIFLAVKLPVCKKRRVKVGYTTLI